MCLGIPGKVVAWINREGPFAEAKVEFDGVQRVCHMACVTDVEVGEYVIIHAGIAISRIDTAEAQRIFEELSAFGEDDDWSRNDP